MVVVVRWLSSLLKFIWFLILLSKSDKECFSYCSLSLMIPIPSISLKVSIIPAFDICLSRLCLHLIYEFLLTKHISQSLLFTSIIFTGGRISRIKRFFFFITDPIIFFLYINFIYFKWLWYKILVSYSWPREIRLESHLRAKITLENMSYELFLSKSMIVLT